MNRAAVLVLAVVTLFAVAAVGQSTKPATRPEAWADIDQRLVFFAVQLASVEASIDATNKQLKAAGYRITARADAAARALKGNELMDRQAGGPVRWQDFYGRTAESFFYNPAPRPGELRLTETVLETRNPNARMPKPADQRPPQFDYIYRANDNARKQAEADIARLAGKVDQLLARRRQLEAEQAGLWTKIAFRAVAGRELLGKPLYRFDVKTDSKDPNAAQQLEAMRAAMDFLRINNKVIEQAERGVEADPAKFVAGFEETVVKSRTDFDNRIMKQPSLVMAAGDRGTTIGKLSAVAKRMNDVAKNVADSHKLARDGDKAGDDQRKETFFAQLQESLLTYAESVAAGDECVNQLAKEWQISPDVEKPTAEVKVELPAVDAGKFSVVGNWRSSDSEPNDIFTFKDDGTFLRPRGPGGEPFNRGTWRVDGDTLTITYADKKPTRTPWRIVSRDELLRSKGEPVTLNRVSGESQLPAKVPADANAPAQPKTSGNGTPRE